MKPYKSYFDTVIKEPSIDYMSILLEKTFDIMADVDLIYDRFFKSLISEFNNKKIDENWLLKYKKLKMSSLELKTKDARKANKINPITIVTDLFDKNNNYYNTHELKINISVNMKVLDAYVKSNYNEKLLSIILGVGSEKLFKHEITKHRLKSSIYHELSHWISDSLYNRHIKTLVDLAKKYKNPELLKLKQKDINLTYFEIDAQIHAIRNLKNMFKDEWDTFTLDKVFLYYNSLWNIAKEVYQKYGEDILIIWQKNLITRMARENLLGKNMRHFINVEDVKDSLYKI